LAWGVDTSGGIFMQKKDGCQEPASKSYRYGVRKIPTKTKTTGKTSKTWYGQAVQSIGISSRTSTDRPDKPFK